jgi:hypothetical protein
MRVPIGLIIAFALVGGADVAWADGGLLPDPTKVVSESKATVDSVAGQQQNSQPAAPAQPAAEQSKPTSRTDQQQSSDESGAAVAGAVDSAAPAPVAQAVDTLAPAATKVVDTTAPVTKVVAAAAPVTTVVDAAAKVVETAMPVAQRVVEPAAPIVRQVVQSTPPVVQDVLDTAPVAKRIVDPAVRSADTGGPRSVARPSSFTSGQGGTKLPAPPSAAGPVPQTHAVTLARSVLPSASEVAAPRAGAVVAGSFETGPRPLAEGPTVGTPAFAAPVRLEDPAQTILQGSGRTPVFAERPFASASKSSERDAAPPRPGRLPSPSPWPAPSPFGAGAPGGAFGLGLFMALLAVLSLAWSRTGRSLRPESLLAPRPGFHSILERPG